MPSTINILNAAAARHDLFPSHHRLFFSKGVLVLAIAYRWLAILTMGISLGFEKEDSTVAEVEVDKMFRLCMSARLVDELGEHLNGAPTVGYETAKVATNYAVPCGPFA